VDAADFELVAFKRLTGLVLEARQSVPESVNTYFGTRSVNGCWFPRNSGVDSLTVKSTG
jgi:hypothetical protein